MEKILKKLLILILSCVLGTTVFAFVACQDKESEPTSFPPTEGIVYEISDDGTYASVVGYQGEDKTVRIASTYENVSVTHIGAEAFLNKNEMTAVTIPDGVTHIEDKAFQGCFALTKITVPDSVVYIDFGAFEGCSGLTEMVLPFAGENLDGEENTHFGYIFGAETWEENVEFVPQSLTKVTLTAATQIKARDFSVCKSLTEIVLPDTLKTIGDAAFYECVKLLKIFIPDSVTYVGGYAFAYCFEVTIYCEATEKDPTWGDRWTYEFPVVWGQTGI